MTLSRLLLAPLRPLRGAVRVSRVTPVAEARITRAVEDRRAWEADVRAWAARERADLQRGYVASWRARRVAEGLCASCTRAPAAEGHVVCGRCLARINARTVERTADRVARGLCGRCGVRPLVSATRCAECLAAGREYASSRLRARVA